MPGPTPAAVPGLRDYLRRIGTAAGRADRAAAFDDLARAAEATGAVVPLVQKLLAGDANGLRFALEVAARLTPPLPPEVIGPLAALVERSRFPTRLRVEVAATLIRSVHFQSPLVPRLIDALRKRVGNARAGNRLRRLAALVPPLEPLAAALAEVEAGSTSACPRCGVRLDADALVRHLWEQHRLLLETGRVREPWDVVGDRIADYRRTNEAEYLDRACDLAQALEPAEGLTRVHRLLLAAGSDDEEAHALLRADAQAKHGSLCPHCYTLIRLPPAVPATPVLVGGGRVEGGGYRVELTDHYVFSRLTIDTPELRLEGGMEPGHALTRRGAVFLFAVPLMFMAALFAFMPRLFGIPPVVPVGGLLFTLVVAYLAVRNVWTDRRDPADRVVDHAWGRLVPRLMRAGVTPPEAAFVAGLALASRPHGDPGARAESLGRAADVLSADRQAAAYATPVRLLQITDAMGPGFDELPAIANEVGLSFTGRLGLDHAEAVVKELRGDPTAATRRARLRVLVLAHAFRAGLEPQDLRTLGRLSPALGAAYASEDRDGLARLRLLWLYRPHRLWQRVGPATTVFDLARYPSLSENYLKQRPDLLLFQAAGGDGSPILICEQGVVFRDELLTRDTPVQVKARSLIRGGGYELSVGDRAFKFRDDPTPLAQRLRAWAEFLFDEFLPRARVLGRRRSAEGDALIGQKSVTCPECRHAFLALAGEIGLKAVPPAEGDA
jgi:hypothetical protein